MWFIEKIKKKYILEILNEQLGTQNNVFNRGIWQKK